MSIAVIEHQVGRFLASEAPEVLAIKGGGVSEKPMPGTLTSMPPEISAGLP